MSGPLDDVRVVSLEQYGAGPYATMHLADLGADVIKIEPPGGGDVGRYVPPYTGDQDSLFFQSLNRNKRSVCLDVTAPEGRDVFRSLVASADAVFSNLRGDVPDKLGLRFADLRPVNPRIVCCSLTGYGMEGPRAANPGLDYMVQGLAGWMSITGEPDGPPTKTGLSVVDFSAGLAASTALVVGIHAARRDGEGGDCDLALLDTAVSMLNYLATWHLTRDFMPTRVAHSGHQTLVPFGNFPTRDGWIVAGGSKEKFWTGMCAALELKYLIDDPRFLTFEARMHSRTELMTILSARFSERTTQEWMTTLEKHSVPCAPVNDLRQALADPQVSARNLVFYQEHEAFGRVGQVRSPVRVGQLPPQAGLRAPRLGEHTDAVLTELGYTTEQVDELTAAGITFRAKRW